MKVGLAPIPSWDVATVAGNVGGRNGRPVVELPALAVGPVVAPNPPSGDLGLRGPTLLAVPLEQLHEQPR
jgi:hypothetical protein